MLIYFINNGVRKQSPVKFPKYQLIKFERKIGNRENFLHVCKGFLLNLAFFYLMYKNG